MEVKELAVETSAEERALFPDFVDMFHSMFLFILVVLYFSVRNSSKAARGRPYSYKISHGPAQCKIFTDLTDCVFPMLFNLGPYLSFDPILMAKVIRVGRAFLKEVCLALCYSYYLLIVFPAHNTALFIRFLLLLK